MENIKNYTSIGVICEGGMASSAMGAAVLRKALNENGLGNIDVKAYPAGLLNPGTCLVVCQKDYYIHIKDWLGETEVFLVENLLHKEDYKALLEKLKVHYQARK